MSLKDWLLSWIPFNRLTYTAFIASVRNESKPVKERITYVYTHIHLFQNEIHYPENKSDLYFISDLLVSS